MPCKYTLSACLPKANACLWWGCLWCLWMACASALTAQESIPCDGVSYLFTTIEDTGNSAMYRVSFDQNTGRPALELVNADIGHRVAASGYSVADQYIYALDERTFELLRIDATGSVTIRGVPRGLDRELRYSAGAMSPDGSRFYVIGAAAGEDTQLFSIRVNQPVPATLQTSVLQEFRAALEDLAFDPLRGTFYGFDRTNKKLVSVDWSSGLYSEYSFESMSGVGVLGSLFFDRSGNLYGFGKPSGSGESFFFSIDKLTGRAQRLAGGPEGETSDGCGCPYTIRSRKRAIPHRVAPCTEMTISYEIINHAGLSYSYSNFTDTLPDGFTIQEVLRAPLGARIDSGPGSNILHLSNFDLLLDTNRIVIRVAVGETVAPGTYSSRSALSDFPAGLGEIIYSDDPLTATALDPTVVEVIDREDPELQPGIRPACDGSGVEISVDLADARYRWSTGDTTRNTFVTAPGDYEVTVTTGCDTYTESVRIESIPEALTLELTDPPPLEPGRTVILQPQITPPEGLTFQWSSSAPEPQLSCLDCPAPVARPVVSTTYYLTVADARGCTAADSLFVEVLPAEKIFAPNAFSPDGDGNNDRFFLQGLAGTARIRSLRVFDRWGNLLFESTEGELNDYTHGWDGTSRGQNLPHGVYLWTAQLELPDGTRRPLSGDVLLVRK